MKHLTGLYRAVTVMLLVAGATLTLDGGGGAAVGAAPRPKATVDVADTGVISADGSTATVVVTASCRRGWTVLEAFVTISQPQANGMGGIPLSCTGRTQTFTVAVRSFDGAFTPGAAQASAFVLVERRGRTQQAQDSAQIQLTAAA